MRTAIDWVVIACMFLALWHNWTSFEPPKKSRTVTGTLERT